MGDYKGRIYEPIIFPEYERPGFSDGPDIFHHLKAQPGKLEILLERDEPREELEEAAE